MNRTLPDSLLEAVGAYLSERIGLSFPPNRRRDLENRLVRGARNLGIESAEVCAGRMLAGDLSERQIESLAAFLTVGETYFFRDPESFEALEKVVLPELIAARANAERRIRIWSAGCSSGEEPYSIAILLMQLLRDLPSWNLTILGSDINPDALKKASTGIYSEWSFRSTPQWIRDRYFLKEGAQRWRIVPEVRQLVTFAFLNLAKDTYPSIETNTNAMDVVMCRNVLMYFTNAQMCKTAKRFFRVLLPDGWLLVSPSEASRSLFSEFDLVESYGSLLFRKPGERSHKVSSISTAVCEAIFERADRSDANLGTGSAATAVGGAKGRDGEPLAPRRTNGRKGGASQGRRTVEGGDERAVPGSSVGPESDAANRLSIVASGPSDDGQEKAEGAAYALLARDCADSGRLEQALMWCDRAIEADKLNPAYRFLKAAVLDEFGDRVSSVRLLKQVLYLEPKHVLARYTLGNHLLKLGNRRDAERHFRTAAKLLAQIPSNESLPGSDGMTAGRLADIIHSIE